MAKEVTLSMRIIARGEEAMRQLNKMEAAIHKQIYMFEIWGKVASRCVNYLVAPIRAVVHALESMAAAAMKAFSLVAKYAEVALRPLKWATAAVLGYAAVLTGLALKAVHSAAGMETLRIRLEAVTGSAAGAAKVLGDVREVAAKGLFNTEELVNVSQSLIEIGVYGKAALKTLADTAAVTRLSMDELVGDLAGLMPRTLRRMGIDLNTEGENFVFTWRDKMGKVKTISATGADDARKALLGIFSEKFGGGMDKFAGSFEGLMTKLKNMGGKAFEQFGEGLLPIAKEFVGTLDTKLQELLNSGKLKKWGEDLGETLENVWDSARAAFAWIKGVWEAMMNQDKPPFVEALRIILVSGARILVEGILAYADVLGTLFVGLGKMVGAAIMQDVLKLPLPGMGALRDKVVKGELDRMTPEQAAAMGIDRDLVGKGYRARMDYLTSPDIHKNLTAAQSAKLTQQAMDLEGRRSALMADEGMAGKLLGASAQRIFESGVEDATKKVPQIAEQFGKAAFDILSGAMKAIEKTTGYTGPSYSKLKQGYAQEREKTNTENTGMVVAKFVRPVLVRGGKGQYGQYNMEEHTATVPAGIELGQVTKGWGVAAINGMAVGTEQGMAMWNKLVGQEPSAARGGAGDLVNSGGPLMTRDISPTVADVSTLVNSNQNVTRRNTVAGPVDATKSGAQTIGGAGMGGGGHGSETPKDETPAEQFKRIYNMKWQPGQMKLNSEDLAFINDVRKDRENKRTLRICKYLLDSS